MDKLIATTKYLQLPFHCYRVSRDNADAFLISGKKVSPFNGVLALALCTRGNLRVNKQGVQYQFQPRDTMFVLPAETAIVESISPNFECMAVVTGYDFYSEIVDGILDVRTQIELSQHPFVSLTAEQYQMIEPMMQVLYNRIEAEAHSTPDQQQHRLLRRLITSMASTIAYELVRIYVSHIADTVVSGELSRKSQVVQEFLILVYQHFAEHRDIQYYADLLHLSPHYLSSLVSEVTGVNASVWVRERVIGEAKRLLDSTTLSVKEVAAALNFPNQSFFGRYFRQYVGTSPQSYRKSALPQR